MHKIILLLLGLLYFSDLTAQTQAIKITNSATNKEKIIQENKKIRLKTSDGQKIMGRFELENDKIIINTIELSLSSVVELKRDLVATSVVTSGLLIYGGVLAGGLGIIAGVFADSSAFLLTIPAAGMIYTGIKSPNLSKNHKIDDGWKFEIVDLD